MKVYRVQVHGLDLVRFIAAILVSVYHLGFRAWASPGHTLNEQLAIAPFRPNGWEYTCFGWVGVQIFFVISGFVIAYSAEGATPIAFIRSRINRLVPAMWIGASLSVVVLMAWGQYDSLGYLYLKSLIFAPIGPWVCGVYWTLGIEIVFYALIFCLLLFDRFRWLPHVTLIISGLSAGFWFGIDSHAFTDRFPRATQLLLLDHGCYFALGTALWLIQRRGLTIVNICVCFLCLFAAHSQISSTNNIEAISNGIMGVSSFTPFVIWCISIAIIILSVTYGSILSKIFAPISSNIRLLGLMTYPLYLIHIHIGGAAMVVAYKSGLAPAYALSTGIATSLLFSFFITAYMESFVKRKLLAILGWIADQLKGRIPAASYLSRETKTLTL
jgi:peptidoglycan/LPS O-acetylase OafA/YrhL